MGAPPSEESVAQMLEDPNTAQMMREALRNPAIVDMMIQNTPHLRNNPQARQIIQSPEFMQMMTNPQAIREAARMRRMMAGLGGGAGGFPAPGVTDSTPGGAAGTNPTANQPNAPPFNLFGGAGFGNPGGAGGAPGANPFAALFGQPGQTTSQTQSPAPGAAAGSPGNPAEGGAAPGPGSPSSNADPAAAAHNPFASLFGGAGGNPFGQMPALTPEQMQEASQAMNFLRQSGVDLGGMFGAPGARDSPGATGSPAPPADTRPPEERYAEQLRQLNDMGFFDFDRNVEALRRSGGSVQGAIEQLLS
jgi:ubiquilin